MKAKLKPEKARDKESTQSTIYCAVKSLQLPKIYPWHPKIDGAGPDILTSTISLLRQ